jgi:antibiotic biosynthesis monooxygenase (ABM) superfamily enzyme
VHNVPFKWCNADLEALFRSLPGYLDAQLLFHENGRSKVGLDCCVLRAVIS